MPWKEIVRVDLAVANTNLSPATKFGNLVCSSRARPGGTR